ncbi:MAG: aspartate dehydrogenase [Candidatus Altiarchaeota archaeon]|nr:aspartate dehydrogenase [Candidatus Altiarchaeota archaeon]
MNVAIIGCGNIGGTIAEAIDKEAGLTLVALFDIDLERAHALGRRLTDRPRVFDQVAGLLEQRDIDIVVEAASQEAVRHYGVRILDSGKELMVMSVGAFIDDVLFERMKGIAEEKGLRIYIPSGAVLGVDGLKSASMAEIDSVTLITRKNPRNLGVDVNRETILYDGPAREGVREYPRNVNVAATLSLAGVGLDKTNLRIIADPAIDKNIHEIQVKGAFGEFKVRVENLPSPENPKTSYLAALSAIATLKTISEAVQIGT